MTFLFSPGGIPCRPADTLMTKKPSTMLRPRRGRQASASGDGVPPSNIPTNSETLQESAPQMRHLIMSQHSNNLLNFLNEDRSRQKFCDVFVSVGGKTYSAHKVVLAHGSSYFHAELSKNPSAKTHVTLEHVEDSVFQHLLSFLYTAECVVAETALPALTEAARFLDMMDILKLLCKDGEVQPVSVIQTQVETIASRKVETTSNNSPGADTEIHSPADVQGNLFGHDNSNQGQLAESVHTDVHQEASNEEEKTTGQGSATTRRSARRRRTPTKYKRNDGEYCSSAPKEKQSTASSRQHNKNRLEGKGEVNVTAKLDVNKPSKPVQGDDVMDMEEEEEERGDANAAIIAETADEAESRADLQNSDLQRTEQQAADRVEMHVGAAAGSSNQSPVYPEGLAPVIIQNSSKKILKCPKCDKTFDRAGGNHGIRSRLLVLFLSYRVNR